MTIKQMTLKEQILNNRHNSDNETEILKIIDDIIISEYKRIKNDITEEVVATLSTFDTQYNLYHDFILKLYSEDNIFHYIDAIEKTKISYFFNRKENREIDYFYDILGVNVLDIGNNWAKVYIIENKVIDKIVKYYRDEQGLNINVKMIFPYTDRELLYKDVSYFTMTRDLQIIIIL